MSRNLHEPTQQRAIQGNRFTGKDTRQRPFVGAWITPVEDADCPPDPDQMPEWTPCLLNDFLQPSALQEWAFRMRYEGDLQFRGAIDASGGAASGTIAIVLPGGTDNEADYWPDESQSYATYVTLDGTSILPATAYVDRGTGEVTITWVAGNELPWARVASGFDDADQIVANNSFTNLTCNYEWNMNTGESGEPYFIPFENLSGTTIGIQVLEDGFYIITAEVFWESAIGAAWRYGYSNTGTSDADWIRMNTFAGQTSTDSTGLVSSLHRLEGAGAVVIPVIWQITGGNREVDAHYLEIVRMGTWTGDFWGGQNPSQ